MTFKLIIFCCLFIIRDDIFVTSVTAPLGIEDTTLTQYPFMASVSGSTWWCPAVLITRRHLITPAFCVDRPTTIGVYFGFEQFPYYLSPPYGNNTQIYNTSRIFTHEGFTNATNKYDFADNIAVVELEQPITYSDTIRPAKLVSEEELDLFEKDAVAQVIGWHHKNKSDLRVETVKVLDRHTCNGYYGKPFLDDQEWCAQSSHYEYLAMLGNAMTYRNKVVGLMVHTHTCLSYSPECTKTHTFVNVVPFLKWISEKVDFSVKQLTGTDEKPSGAQKNMEETTRQREEIDAKCQQKPTHDEQILDEILSKFKSYSEAQTNQMDKIIKNLKEIENKRIKKLEEQMNNLTDNLKTINVHIDDILKYVDEVPGPN